MRLRATTLSRKWVAGSGGVEASFLLAMIINHFSVQSVEWYHLFFSSLCFFWELYSILIGLHVLQELVAGFDQEAAAAVMARLVAFKMEAEVFHDTS